MGKPQNVIPTQKIHVTLPITLLTRLATELWSDAEGRVPFGAYMKFFSSLLEKYFASETLDLSPYINSPSGTFLVSGDSASIEQLKERLK